MSLRFALVASVLTAAPLTAQGAPSPLVGTWTLEVVDNINPDGSRVHLYGDHPQGILVFDAGGHYALQIMRASRPVFAANDRLKGSDAEVRAVAEGVNTHWGRYSDSVGAIQVRIEHASFPNWEGQARVLPYTITGDRLTYKVAAPSTGGTGVTGEVVWRRAR